MNRETLIEKLKDDLAHGRVVTIAGTGVSVAACGNQEVEGFKVATWTGLLQHGVKHCQDIGVMDDDDVEILSMQIRKGKTDIIITAAETISQRMKAKGDGTFRGWLKDTIGKLKIKDREILDAVAALPGVLATLNYDNLLEDATERSAVTWLKADDVQDVLTRVNVNAVLHPHGWFREPESVVLGLSSYLAVKDHPHAKAVLQLFTLDRTLLFVGCGDTVLDPNFTRLIEWGKETLKDVAPRHYLLCRTSVVAEFQKKLADAPWLQPLDYGPDYKDLVPFLRSLVPAGGVVAAPKAAAPAAPSFDLPAYQQAMRKRYGRLKLEDLDPTTHDVRALTLAGMFIAQSARECAEFMPRVFELPKELQKRLREAGEMEGAGLDEETLKEHRRAYFDQSPRPIVEIVNDPAITRLVVLGDPGSGKSTLLQYLLLQWAEKAAPDLVQEPLPLLIELREYARLRHEGQADGFLGYLHGGAGVRWHFDTAHLDAWLRARPSFILFDGLDEVFDPTLRRAISIAIHRFADTYPLARIVVTSRIIGYQHQAWRDEEFRHFMLQELGKAQIDDFLTRWHRGAYEEPEKGEAKRALLVRAIADSAAIRQLAGNPLLLTMMAILNRTQDLPRDRAELYEQCARLLLHQWKVDVAFSSYPELANASLDFKDKRSLLLRVARTMQTSARGLAGNLIDEDALEGTLAEGLNDVPNLRPDRAARALIEQLRGRNFMLCSMGGRSYAFVHRTFLEYFCAVEIRERFQTEQTLSIEQLKTEIFGHWSDESWHEVLSLLAAMIAPRFVAEILAWLIQQPDHGETCEAVFFAARYVGEVRKTNELGPIATEVLERVKALTRFDLTFCYEQWGEEHTQVRNIRRRAIRMVAQIWREAHDTLPWLKTCAQTDKSEVVRQGATQELSSGWKHDPETFQLLKVLARSDEHSSVREASVEGLARNWKDDPETLQLIKALAANDPNEFVRGTAVREAANCWKEDPSAISWLKVRALADRSMWGSKAAVQGLARNWKANPDTLPWLKSQMRSNEHSYMWQTLVEELARSWKDDPDTLSLLKVQARLDHEQWVCNASIQQLARGWKDDPETLPIIKTCARSSKHFIVRGTAATELASRWKDDPESLLIVQTHARFDAILYVREAAVQELARRWKANPETLKILKNCAKSDTNGTVRKTAMQELVRRWGEDPETLPILKAHAQADVEYIVRKAAVQELARGWKGDLDTLPILKVRAQSDENKYVRAAAARELTRGWRDDSEILKLLENLRREPALRQNQSE